jgi:four helix bundle protein
MAEPIRSYRDLVVWQRAMGLVSECYQLSKELPSDERYGLTSQIRRAAVSVPANIAEGNARRGPKEYLHHVSIAQGSLAELETELMLAEDLGYVSSKEVATVLDQAADVGRLLSRLEASLRRSSES